MRKVGSITWRLRQTRRQLVGLVEQRADSGAAFRRPKTDAAFVKNLAVYFSFDRSSAEDEIGPLFSVFMVQQIKTVHEGG